MKRQAMAAGAFDAVVCNHWALGGAGAVDLARSVQRAAEQPANFKFLYALEVGIIQHLSYRRKNAPK